MSQITVDVKHHQYPIYIDSNLINRADLFTSHIVSNQVFVITNETLSNLYLDSLEKSLSEFDVSVFKIQDGERFKSFETFQSIIDELISGNFRRNATIVALGGGVVGDIAGFSAACYQRGIPFIQIPTTLLAMVDSSVGGKTAINHPLAKNMVGAFYQPQAVIADIQCLTTLPDREFSAGMAEVIKYGLIYDPELLDFLERQVLAIRGKEPEALTHIIRRSCEIKAKIVGEDEKEKGVRAILNLGHTFGHAIEKVGGYTEFLHGEAVAIGTCMAMSLALEHSKVSAEYCRRVCRVFENYDLPTRVTDQYDDSELLSAMRHDKKNQSTKITLVVPDGEGRVVVSDQFDDLEILKAIRSRMT